MHSKALSFQTAPMWESQRARDPRFFVLEDTPEKPSWSERFVKAAGKIGHHLSSAKTTKRLAILGALGAMSGGVSASVALGIIGLQASTMILRSGINASAKLLGKQSPLSLLHPEEFKKQKDIEKKTRLGQIKDLLFLRQAKKALSKEKEMKKSVTINGQTYTSTSEVDSSSMTRMIKLMERGESASNAVVAVKEPRQMREDDTTREAFRKKNGTLSDSPISKLRSDEVEKEHQNKAQTTAAFFMRRHGRAA